MSSSQSSVSRSIRLRSLVGFRPFDNFDVRLLNIIFNRGRVGVIIVLHFVGFRFRFRLIRFRVRFLGFWRFCRFRSMLLIRSRILIHSTIQVRERVASGRYVCHIIFFFCCYLIYLYFMLSIFNCEDAAQQVLMSSVCLSVCPCVQR